MNREIVDTAVSFVDLVLASHARRLEGRKEWPEKSEVTLLRVISAAGFGPKAVVPGQLFRHLGRDYRPINKGCPFKVVDQTGRDDYFATGWLDCAFRRVRFGLNGRQEDRSELIEAICIEIQNSVPLKPIKLTHKGDFLHESPRKPDVSGFGHFVRHVRDKDDVLQLNIGIHMSCGGWMHRAEGTLERGALACEACGLRVTFLRGIRTYGDLRHSLEDEFIAAV